MKIVVLIDELGKITFKKVADEIVEEYINEKAQEGYLVSVISNASVKSLASGEIVEFEIDEVVEEIEE
ncbi:hypothetical protein [Caminibacter sp.]